MGRPKLNIFLHNCGFLNGTKERVLRLYPNLTFTASVRKIVENHLNQMERATPLSQSYGSSVDTLLDQAPPMAATSAKAEGFEE